MGTMTVTDYVPCRYTPLRLPRDVATSLMTPAPPVTSCRVTSGRDRSYPLVPLHPLWTLSQCPRRISVPGTSVLRIRDRRGRGSDARTIFPLGVADSSRRMVVRRRVTSCSRLPLEGPSHSFVRQSSGTRPSIKYESRPGSFLQRGNPIGGRVSHSRLL